MRSTAFQMAALAAAACAFSGSGARAAAPPAAGPSEVDGLIAARIHHVFIIYQENRSFDNEFGTFPGAEGIWSDDARTHGFYQRDWIEHKTITPFRIADPDVFAPTNGRLFQTNAFNRGRMDEFVAQQ